MPQDCQIALRRRGICVIIPTYNNAGTVADVVTRALAYCQDVYVVLDGCTDDTRARLEQLAVRPVIVEIPRNSGKGNALRVGFRRAKADGFAYAITLDADGQHFPEDIPFFLEANCKHPGALIVGKRRGLESVDRSKSSSFANAFSNFWFFLQTLVPLKDTQTGYRLYPLKKMGALSLLTSRYEAELELLVFAAWRGVRIVSQDVRVFYPEREKRVSHFRPFADFARISLLNVALCILMLVYGWPRMLISWLWKAFKTIGIFLFYVFVMLFVVTPGCFVYLKLGRHSEEKKEALHRFICRFSRLGSKVFGLLGNPYTLAGRTEEDFSRPAVIVCNHQSHLDLLPMLGLTPKLVILTADWVWHNPLYGFIIREADYLPASQGLEAIVPRLKELAQKGYSIVVYPESTRSLDGRIGRFHQGAFFLADQLDLDILPVVLYGAGRALPKHGRLLNRWPIRLEIDKRITRGEISSYGESYKAQASSLRKYYTSRLADIADRMEQTLS